MSLKILYGICDSLLKTARFPLSITGSGQQIRYRRCSEPVLRTPYWYKRQMELDKDEKLTEENQKFVTSLVYDNYALGDSNMNSFSPLKAEPFVRKTWSPGCSRTGVIGIHLGTMPHWFKDGKKTRVTLIQVLDNHVINYLPPGSRDLRPYVKRYAEHKRGKGSLVVGAVTGDPLRYTKEYCEIFRKSGVLPKKILTKFEIHPDARLPLGTPLFAGHFQPGDIVDVTGKTRYQGFQGVMKRWGFHGMPATHGQTKTHRRPGNIGAGGEKARVWPGKKMPGHVGNKTRTARGLQVVRINHKHNVLYIYGTIPGEVNSFVYVHDTICKQSKERKKYKVSNVPYFPTYYPGEDPGRPEEEFHESIFNFADPSIVFEPEKQATRKR